MQVVSMSCCALAQCNRVMKPARQLPGNCCNLQSFLLAWQSVGMTAELWWQAELHKKLCGLKGTS
jgi:hypothetical protein